MEHWHFLAVQIWIHNVGSFLVAIFEVLVFVVALFSMDYTALSGDFLKLFAFECKVGTSSVWWIGKTFKSGTTWELHFMIIFIYTTVSLIVLATVPYKYDRLKKTEKEIELERKIEEKKKNRKKKKREEKKRKRNALKKRVSSIASALSLVKDKSKDAEDSEK